MKIFRHFIFIIIILLMGALAYASEPEFQVHRLEGLLPGVNYSVNFPVIMDYDRDGDQDIIIMTKEGKLIILENLTKRD